uniref:Uncharacterized protein n=1 Tax=Anguilla anguilla TaxID=7936 RepID=A0A0E9QSS4_ANGAN
MFLGKIKGPTAGLEGPHIDFGSSDGKTKGPSFKIPSLDINAPKITPPDISLKAPKTKGEVDITGDLKVPCVHIEGSDVDIKGPDGKIKGPNFKMPSLDIKAPKISLPDV